MEVSLDVQEIGLIRLEMSIEAWKIGPIRRQKTMKNKLENMNGIHRL